MVLLRAILVLGLAACGQVAIQADASTGDGSNHSDGSDGSSVCGGAGQACCANNSCTTGLACNANDQVCRTGELWVIGNNGGESGSALVAHSTDGSNFTLTTIGTGFPQAIWGTAADDIWVIGTGPTGSSGQTSWARHWNGTDWGPTSNFSGYSLYALWGNAPNNYWALNNAGAALHWTGSAWSQPQPISGSAVFSQIWGAGATDIWALASNVVAHWNGSGTWTSMSRSDFATLSPGAISGFGTRMFSGGYTIPGTQKPAVLRWDGSQYAVDTLDDGQVDCSTTLAVWAGADDAWALTGATFSLGGCDLTPTVWRYSGGTWTSMGKLSGASLPNSMWGTSNRDLYATGNTTGGARALFHFDGTSWTTVYMNTDDFSLRAAWGTGQQQQ